MINKLTRISLTGMMGSGKTNIGKLLAKKINLPFYDSDEDIEDKLNLKISEIFEKYGESWFREQEEKICIDILQKEKFVLALGGGAITNIGIRDSIAKNSLLIYLKTDENILFERLKNDKSRPLLKGTNLKKQINSILEDREKLYSESDIIIENNVNDIEAVVEEIISLIKKSKL
ncbi:MAG: shikimate kinase [Alphaproteobacteria bacterium]